MNSKKSGRYSDTCHRNNLGDSKMSHYNGEIEYLPALEDFEGYITIHS